MTIILKRHEYEEVPACSQQVAGHTDIICDRTAGSFIHSFLCFPFIHLQVQPKEVDIVGQGNIIAMPTFTIYMSHTNSCRPVSCYHDIQVCDSKGDG
jgi:hypothetical protein